jgi:hypothetical protein
VAWLTRLLPFGQTCQIKRASSEPLIAKVYWRIARLDVSPPGFFAFQRLNGQNSINRKIVPEWPVFNALHSGKHNDEVQLMAFDVLATDRKARSAGVDAQKPILLACSHVGRMAFFLANSSRARLDQDRAPQAACNAAPHRLVPLIHPERGVLGCGRSPFR